MIQLVLGSLALSLIHAMIPSHWLPLVAIGRVQNWTRRETLLVTGITGVAHSSSTILIGVAVGLLGYGLAADTWMTSVLPPVVLIGVGTIFVLLDRRSGHHHHEGVDPKTVSGRSSKASIVASLSLAMFFSPCIEIEVYYLQAGVVGWFGILTVSTIYLLVTVAGMMTLVYFGLAGARRIRAHYLEHHERQITGLVLIGLGLLTLMART